MSTYRKCLILCVTFAILAVQVQLLPDFAQAGQSTATAPKASFTKGTVIETMNAAGYSYLNLENDGQRCWVAIPATQVEVGDEIEIAAGMEMKNFSSKTLGRTFDSIIFSQGLVKR